MPIIPQDMTNKENPMKLNETNACDMLDEVKNLIGVRSEEHKELFSIDVRVVYRWSIGNALCASEAHFQLPASAVLEKEKKP